MKHNILPAIRLTIVCLLIFVVIYPAFIWGIAQFVPAKGNGQTISANNKVVGYDLVGQHFSDDQYFNGRPSAVGYNAAGSAGSNKGPSNPGYLKDVQNRIDSFLAHNPGVLKENIPAELVTASGSGLDPDISPTAAKVQIKRIAALRKISEDKLLELVEKQTQQPFLGLMGTARVNVLRLNIALDKVKSNN